MRSIRSMVPWAIPSMRIASYSTGFTKRRRLTPMFFIARTVAPMLIGFCGSYRTTTTASRSELLIDVQWDQAVLVVAIAAEINELTATAAEHELSAPTFSTAGHFIHDDIQCVRDRTGKCDVEIVAARCRRPTRVDRSRRAPAVQLTNANGRRVALRNEYPSAQRLAGTKIELYAIPVDVRRFVVVAIDSVGRNKGPIAPLHANIDLEGGM